MITAFKQHTLQLFNQANNPSTNYHHSVILFKNEHYIVTRNEQQPSAIVPESKPASVNIQNYVTIIIILLVTNYTVNFWCYSM